MGQRLHLIDLLSCAARLWIPAKPGYVRKKCGQQSVGVRGTLAVLTEVGLEVAELAKSFVAKLTLERLQPGVDVEMRLQVRFLGEALAADLAHERPIPLVYRTMSVEVPRLREALAARLALELFRPAS